MSYSFPSRGEFVDREAELGRLTRWWDDASDGFPLVLHGRRRTGKSWLLRRFADGKEADILVCDTRSEGDQLARFAAALAPSLGVHPALNDARSLFALLHRRARNERRLAVIDEFPLLLNSSREADGSLAGVIDEELGSSHLKLILCGSHVGVMGGLLAERRPLSGRGRPMLLRPARFATARQFLAGLAPAEAVMRYAIAGGMPLYLRRLGRRGSLKDIICADLLDPLGPFFNEPRDVLAMELTSVADHFSLLAALAGRRDLSWDDLLTSSHVERSTASRYLRILEDLHIVTEASPMFAHPSARRRRYRISDPLMRFWFRFVLPFQADLAAGLRPEDHWSLTVEPRLADHAAIAFEEICQDWVRRRFGGTTESVGGWWGPARHDLRRARLRTSEEIDLVGARGRTATVIGEARWRRQPMPRQVLDDLLELKVPALAQAGVDVTSTSIVLFSRAGFSRSLMDAAAAHGRVQLIGLDELVADAAELQAR